MNSSIADHDHGAGPISWWQAEPRRLERDRHEITTRFPQLHHIEPARAVRGAGGWGGRLPLWPFDRGRPVGLDRVGPALELELVYSQAHPVVAPSIFPIDPDPALIHYTEHRWHLNGDGSLCLLRDGSQWTGAESVVELLLKAAGWRIEYALLCNELLETMTEDGIVSDPTLDDLLSYLPEPVDRRSALASLSPAVQNGAQQ